MPLTGAIIAGATGLLQTGLGIGQKAKAAKMARKNPRPDLKDSKYLQDMYQLTGAYAGQGLSDEAKQAYISQNDRNLGSSLDAILRSGGSPNLISDIYDDSQSGVRQLALADDTAKMRNMERFLTVQDKKADEERDKFFVNQYAPWKDKAQMIAGLSQQGMDNIWKGINTMGSAAVGYADSKQYASKSLPDGGDFSKVTASVGGRNNPGYMNIVPTVGRNNPQMYRNNNMQPKPMNYDMNALLEYYSNLHIPGSDETEYMYQ
jgi:hypothetical protein